MANYRNPLTGASQLDDIASCLSNPRDAEVVRQYARELRSLTDVEIAPASFETDPQTTPASKRRFHGRSAKSQRVGSAAPR